MTDRKGNIENIQLPEIRETDEEKKLTIGELKKINFLWALNNLRGKSFFNKSTNREISISRDGLGEWKTKTKSKEQVISIKILGQLLENAVLKNRKQHIPVDSNIIEVLYFWQDCKVNDKMYTAVITVKAIKLEKRYKYYHHFLDDYKLNPKV